jgi:methyltransferase (TIGR00027 family)
VAIDLRHDWPSALKEAGFDPTKPTAWSAEGLLAFLPPEAQDRLLDNITALSAPGSRFAGENMTNAGGTMATMVEQMNQAVDRWREHGFDVEMTDLWDLGERNDVAEYLDGHGWKATRIMVSDLYAASGLTLDAAAVDDEEAQPMANFSYVTASRT